MALPLVGELGFVNHFITLLRNNRVVQTAGDIPCGDEFFVDPRHLTLDVPNELQAVLNAIFGTAPEHCYFNLRMFVLLQALHATEFVKTVLDPFPRITYDLNSSALIDAGYGTSRVVLSLPEGSPLVELTVIGTLLPDHGLGRLQENWIIDVTDDPASILWGSGSYPAIWGGAKLLSIINTLDGSTVQHNAADRRFPLHSIAFRDDILEVLFTTSAAEIPSGIYTVSALARPDETLVDIERRVRELGPRTLDALFSSSEKVELGKRLFNQHDQVLYRVAGIAIAVLFKLEELRSAGKFLSAVSG